MNGIQTENTTDTGGGQNVGWIDGNDWMDYSVNVSTAGTYNVAFRVASGTTGGQMQLRNSSGSVLATVNIAGTGGWQTWATVNATATLAAGAQTLRLFAVTGGYNVNYVQFSTTTTPPPPTSTKYYIKNRWQNTYLYDAGDRVRYNTSTAGTTYQWTLEDVGNGQRELRNVGTGEYMHVENLQGYVQCTARTAGWGSARWTTEDAGSGFVRIKNVWQSTSYIHVENLAGHAQYGAINTAWMSAQWLLEAVPAGTRASVEEADMDERKVMYWPTAVVDDLHILTDGTFERVDVVDLVGRNVVSKSIINEKEVTLDVRSLTGGIHVVKMIGRSKNQTFRILKK
jgi:hypothetical protein